MAAYGRILPPEVLAIPPRLPGGAYGCVNVHGSILPRFRGAAPVQRAILQGDPRTGVTLMSMDEGLDTGGILAVRQRIKDFTCEKHLADMRDDVDSLLTWDTLTRTQRISLTHLANKLELAACEARRAAHEFE